jgi:hypothetical protein
MSYFRRGGEILHAIVGFREVVVRSVAFAITANLGRQPVDVRAHPADRQVGLRPHLGG